MEKDRDIREWSGWQTLSDEAVKNLVAANVLYIPMAMIENDVLRGYGTYVLANSHPKFWTCPSSSTGKYHPKQHNMANEVIPGLEVGGLISHLWHVMAFAFESMRRYGYNSKLSRAELAEWARTRDCLAFACIFHDWAKNGDPTKGLWGDHTTKDHGEVAAKLISTTLLDRFLVAFPEIRGEAETDLIGMVNDACVAIKHHYGIWAESRLKPTSPGVTELSLMLQEGDYYSTRRFISIPDGRLIVDVLRSVDHTNLSGPQSRITPIVAEAKPQAAAPEQKKADTADFIW